MELTADLERQEVYSDSRVMGQGYEGGTPRS